MACVVFGVRVYLTVNAGSNCSCACYGAFCTPRKAEKPNFRRRFPSVENHRNRRCERRGCSEWCSFYDGPARLETKSLRWPPPFPITLRSLEFASPIRQYLISKRDKTDNSIGIFSRRRRHSIIIVKRIIYHLYRL